MQANVVELADLRAIPAVFPLLPYPDVALRWAVAVAVLVLFALGATLLAYWRGRRDSARRVRWLRLGLIATLVCGLVEAGLIGRVLQNARRSAASPDQLEHSDAGPTDSLLNPSSWPTDRGDWSRTAARSGDDGPAVGEVLWRHRRTDEAFYGSPASDGRRIYAVGSTGDRARIYAFDSRSGDVQWGVSPPDYQATFSSPVLHHGRLYCGEGLHHSQRARLVCLDARPGASGRLLWTFPVDSHLESTPTVVADRIYFGAGDDGVYALSEASDGRSARPAFHLTGKICPDAETSVAVVDQRIYVGLGLGGQALVALDARDGRELGRLRFPHPVFGVPSVADGKLYVGMGQGDYLTPDRAAAGQVVCVDLAQFRVEWTIPLPASVLGAVAIVGEELTWCCADGTLHAASRDGRMRRSFSTGAPIAGSPAVTAARIYVVNFAGRLLAVDRATFTLAWSLPIGEPGTYTGSPIVADGRVFVGTHRDGFVCVGPRETP